MCDGLAVAGFTALAPDLYNGQTTTEPDVAERLTGGLDVALAQSTIGAAAAFLRQEPYAPVGAVGLSLGGWHTLGAATRGIFDAVVAYYAILHPSEYGQIGCPVLGHLAEFDEWESLDVPRSFFDRLTKDGTPATYHVYSGTEHSFANPRAAEYDPVQAAAAWQRTLTFLVDQLQTTESQAP